MGTLPQHWELGRRFFENHKMFILNSWSYFSSVWGEASWGLAMLWSKCGFDYCVVMVKRAMCGEHVFLLKFLFFWHVYTKNFYHDYDLVISFRWLFQCACYYSELRSAIMSYSRVQVLLKKSSLGYLDIIEINDFAWWIFTFSLNSYSIA